MRKEWNLHILCFCMRKLRIWVKRHLHALVGCGEGSHEGLKSTALNTGLHANLALRSFTRRPLPCLCLCSFRIRTLFCACLHHKCYLSHLWCKCLVRLVRLCWYRLWQHMGATPGMLSPPGDVLLTSVNFAIRSDSHRASSFRFGRFRQS